MSKALTNEIMAILRQFEIAGELSSKKSITQTKEFQPKLTTRIVTFLFERRKFYAIYDATADDDDEYLAELVAEDDPSAKGMLVENPHDTNTTYGMRFKGKELYLFEVLPDKRRLDLELTARYPELSRSTIQKYIKSGYVTVNDEVVIQPKYDVASVDTIALTLPQKTDYSTHDMPIIYLDDNVIVVNKPAGVLTHSKGTMNDEFTVAEFFRRYTTHGLATSRPGIVHRLDRDTSGVMIGARHDEAAAMLKKQFADRRVKKQYVAVVDGIPKLDKAVIDLPIGRNPAAPSTFRVDAAGKPALTTYEVLASNGSQSLVSLLPKTGRTHQLRVHLQYVNTPISGDRVYGKTPADRLYLHAHSLELTIPVSKRMTFTAPVPPEFTKHFPGALGA
jgi:23S rRNA pseudouridine1911/1915/1917 synthase